MQLIYTTWWIWRQLYFQEGFPGSSAGKESAPSLIPELGSSPGEGIGYPTPVFLGFPGGWDGKESTCNAGDCGLIPELGRSLEEGMATHSSILAWRIPMDKEPGRLWSMGLQRVRHNWATKQRAHTLIVSMSLVNVPLCHLRSLSPGNCLLY